MAKGGGAPRGITKGARRLANAVTLAVGLNALQQTDSRNDDEEEPRISDSSRLTDETGPSPLDLPKKSYAMASEFEEQRQKEARMRQTAEEFVGAPVFPKVEGKAPPSTKNRTPGAEPLRTETQAEKTMGREYVESVRARYLAEYKDLEAKRRQGTQEQQKAAMEKLSKDGVDQKMKRLQRLWRVVNGLDAVTAEDVVGGILLLGMLNVQMINHFTAKKYELIPKPSVVELSLASCLDLGVCCSLLPTLGPFCLIIILIGLAYAGLINWAIGIVR